MYSNFSKRHTKTHTLCRRCGNRAFHRQHKSLLPSASVRLAEIFTLYVLTACAQCGYPSAKLRSYNWGLKAKRRKTTGTGRMAHLKDVSRRFKNGFRYVNPLHLRLPPFSEVYVALASFLGRTLLLLRRRGSPQRHEQLESNLSSPIGITITCRLWLSLCHLSRWVVQDRMSLMLHSLCIRHANKTLNETDLFVRTCFTWSSWFLV